MVEVGASENVPACEGTTWYVNEFGGTRAEEKDQETESVTGPQGRGAGGDDIIEGTGRTPSAPTDT